MGDTFTEDGERLEFVGLKDTHVRGTVVTDGMERWCISPEEFGSEDLVSILPDEVELWPDTDEKESDEYVFLFKVTAYRPTGEFREEE